MKKTQTPRDPMAVMERAMQDGTLSGLDLPRGTIRAALDLSGDALDQCALKLGRAGSMLPRGTIPVARRQSYGQKRYEGQADYLAQTARALSLCPFVAEAIGVKPEKLLDLSPREAAYRGFSLLGDRIATYGMDLRAAYGAYLWYLVDETLSYLEGRLADPALSRAEEEQLLDQFGPALILIDDALRKPVVKKEAYAELRGELGERLREAEVEARLAETELSVKHDLPAARQALFEAARRHFQKRGELPPGDADAGSEGSAAERDGRKIIR